MPILRPYECPDCEGTFEYLHMRLGDEPPAFCPLCGSSTAAEPRLPAPHIARPIGKIADNVYRQMETASEVRAEMAAEALGESVADMASMKLTNMTDNARVGENNAVSTRNAVTAAMGRSVTPVGLQDARSVAEYAKSTRVGPYAGAGSSALDNVKREHAMQVPRVIAAGRV